MTILGCSYDSPEDNRAFAEKFDFPFDLLSDPDKTVAQAYGAHSPEQPDYPCRNTYVIDREGKLAHAFEGVNPKEEPEELLKLLE